MKTVVVTGGTRGIGRAIVDALSAGDVHAGIDPRELRVIATYRSRMDDADRLKADLMQQGVDCDVQRLDLSDRESIDHFVSTIVQRYERIDGLINNAGMADDGSFLMMDDERVHSLIRTNLSGSMYLTERLMECLLRADKPAVVLISSAAGVYGKEGQVPYSTTKGGLIGYCQLLGRRFSDRGLQVNAVAPGFIETDMVTELDSKMFAHTLNSTSTGNMGKVADVARVVLSLLAPGYVQATTIKVDGGQLR